jgi:hypothetical protein
LEKPTYVAFPIAFESADACQRTRLVLDAKSKLSLGPDGRVGIKVNQPIAIILHEVACRAAGLDRCNNRQLARTSATIAFNTDSLENSKRNRAPDETWGLPLEKAAYLLDIFAQKSGDGGSWHL